MANRRADADLSGGPGGLVRDELDANLCRDAKDGVAQPVAQKLRASSVGVWRRFVHVLAMGMNFRHSGERGLTFFVQLLIFLAYLNAVAKKMACLLIFCSFQPKNSGLTREANRTTLVLQG